MGYENCEETVACRSVIPLLSVSCFSIFHLCLLVSPHSLLIIPAPIKISSVAKIYRHNFIFREWIIITSDDVWCNIKKSSCSSIANVNKLHTSSVYKLWDEVMFDAHWAFLYFPNCSILWLFLSFNFNKANWENCRATGFFLLWPMWILWRQSTDLLAHGKPIHNSHTVVPLTSVCSLNCVSACTVVKFTFLVSSFLEVPTYKVFSKVDTCPLACL